MVDKCIVCGKTYDTMAVNPDYPDKKICLSCLNGFLLNLKNIEKELDPLVKNIEGLLDDIDKKL